MSRRTAVRLDNALCGQKGEGALAGYFLRFDDRALRQQAQSGDGGQVTLDSVRIFEPCPHHLIPSADADDLFSVFVGADNRFGDAARPQALKV